jgi:hypothetical protein
VQRRAVAGFVDSCELRSVSYEISGWATCPDRRPPDEVFALAAKGGADGIGPWIARPDVLAAVGVERAGFQLPLPLWAETGPVSVVARCGDELLAIPGSPVRCPRR